MNCRIRWQTHWASTEILLEHMDNLSHQEFIRLLTDIRDSNLQLHRVTKDLINEFETKFMKKHNIINKIFN